MRALDWFVIFVALFVIMAAISGWMAWFWRRSMRSHKTQIDEMIHEMRQAIDDEAGRPDDEDAGTNNVPGKHS